MLTNTFRRIALAQGLLRKAPPPPKPIAAPRDPPADEPRREPADQRPAQG